MSNTEIDTIADGKHRVYATCTRCDMEVTGTSTDPEEAGARLKNNMRLHREGGRCARRAYAQKRESM